MMKDKRRKSWGMGAGVGLVAAWIAVGGVCQAVGGEVPWEAWNWPLSGALLTAYGCVCVLGYWALRRVGWLRMMLSGAVAIPALVGVLLVTGLMGIFVQVPDGWAAHRADFWHRVGAGWPMLCLYAWLSWLLGWAVIHRCMQLTVRSFRSMDLLFLCFHAGFWLVLVAGSLGQADEVRVHLPVGSGRVLSRALDARGRLHTLPFGVTLDSLRVETYASSAPRQVVSHLTFVPAQDRPWSARLQVNHPLQVEGWRVYLVGYEEGERDTDAVSRLELVYDPWQPGVRVGLVCLVLGALGLLFRHPSGRKEEKC